MFDTFFCGFSQTCVYTRNWFRTWRSDGDASYKYISMTAAQGFLFSSLLFSYLLFSSPIFSSFLFFSLFFSYLLFSSPIFSSLLLSSLTFMFLYFLFWSGSFSVKQTLLIKLIHFFKKSRKVKILFCIFSEAWGHKSWMRRLICRCSHRHWTAVDDPQTISVSGFSQWRSVQDPLKDR